MNGAAVPVLLQNQNGRLFTRVRIVLDHGSLVDSDQHIFGHNIIGCELPKAVARYVIFSPRNEHLHAAQRFAHEFAR